MNDYKKLKEPFDPADLEWRVGRVRQQKNGNFVDLLCYITARAVMDRFDEVCGPAFWRAEYAPSIVGEGVECTIFVKNGTEWVGKSDASDQSQIEQLKGAYSGALKRAAVHWGIGRYLYKLPNEKHRVIEGWGGPDDINVFHQRAHIGHVKRPGLPDWALPTSSKPKSKPKRTRRKKTEQKQQQQTEPQNGKPLEKEDQNKTEFSEKRVFPRIKNDDGTYDKTRDFVRNCDWEDYPISIGKNEQWENWKEYEIIRFHENLKLSQNPEFENLKYKVIADATERKGWGRPSEWSTERRQNFQNWIKDKKLSWENGEIIQL